MEIGHYTVRFNGGPKAGRDNLARAQMHLFSKESKLLGYVNFYEDDMDLPEDEQKEQYIMMHLHLHLLHAVIDALRNEQPAYIVWRKQDNYAYISTTQEPVGEGDERIS